MGQAHLEPALAIDTARRELVSAFGDVKTAWRKSNDVLLLLQVIRGSDFAISHDIELREFGYWCCEWAHKSSNAHKSHDAREGMEAYLRRKIDLEALIRRCDAIQIPEVRRASDERRQSLFLAWQRLGQGDPWRVADDCSAHARHARFGGNGRNRPSRDQANELRRLLGVNPFEAPLAAPALF